MRLPVFSLQQPKDLEGVVKALAESPGPRLLAGGTDLLVNMKHRVDLPETLVSVRGVAALRGIRQEGDETIIGAATTLKEIHRHPEILRKFTVLAQAAGSVGSARHQAMGSLGGNLCQNTRCRFFNQSWQWRQARSLCYKAGGEDCHVIGKKNSCFSTYSGDVAPALLVLEASARITGPKGTREVPLADLYSGDGRRPLALDHAEVLTALVIPGESAKGHSHYEKFSLRGSIEFPVVGAAVWRGDGKLRAAFTGVDRAPIRAVALETELAGKKLTGARLKQAQALAPKAARIAPTSVHPVAFKRELMGALFIKAIRAIS